MTRKLNINLGFQLQSQKVIHRYQTFCNFLVPFSFNNLIDTAKSAVKWIDNLFIAQSERTE